MSVSENHVTYHLDVDPNDPRNAVPAEVGITVDEAAKRVAKQAKKDREKLASEVAEELKKSDS